MKVKIKTWNQMEAQYGLKLDKHQPIVLSIIDIDSGFTGKMENAMPNDRIINIKGNIGDTLFLWGFYSISYLMIEAFMDERYSIYGERVDVR